MSLEPSDHDRLVRLSTLVEGIAEDMTELRAAIAAAPSRERVDNIDRSAKDRDLSLDRRLLRIEKAAFAVIATIGLAVLSALLGLVLTGGSQIGIR